MSQAKKLLCASCNILKVPSQFYAKSDSKVHLNPSCKACCSAQNKVHKRRVSLVHHQNKGSALLQDSFAGLLVLERAMLSSRLANA